MKSFWKSEVFIALAAVTALSLCVDDSFARGGSMGGRGGFGGASIRSSSGSVSSFKSSPPPAPRVFAPAPTPHVPTPAPSVVPKTATLTPPQSSVKPGFITTQPAPAPMARTFDSAGAKANHEAASRQKFEAAQAPKALSGTQTTAHPYEYKRDQHVQGLRSELAGEKWKNRQLRQDQAFGGYYNRPAAALVFAQQSYHDPFGNMFFWMWLLDRPHERDTWLYHHQGNVDPARLAELKSKDADLDQRLKALEASGVKRDSSYTPAELKHNKDLMYGDDVVKEAAKAEHSMSWLWYVLGGLFALGAFVYLVFFRRWNVGVRQHA